MINHACAHGFLQGVSFHKSGPPLSHLFFADDSLLFLKATRQNCLNLHKILQAYCCASGQKINFDKSTIFFSANTPTPLQDDLCSCLHIEKTDNPGNYLGIPTMWGRSKKEALAYVKERILAKIQGWKQCLLSQAGKETLIKSVALSIPTYPMSVFKFPLTLCSDIDSAIASFWWGSNGDQNKIHWVSWRELGLPTLDGGTDFRNLSDFNIALLAKQCWRLLQEPDSFWAQVIKSRYYPHCNFAHARKGSRASWAWSSMLEARDLIMRGAHWQVIDGSCVNLWTDRWVYGVPDLLLHPIDEVHPTTSDKVKTIINQQTHQWDLTRIRDHIDDHSATAILALPLGDGSVPDRIVWPHHASGSYTVKSGYRLHHGDLPNIPHQRPSSSRWIPKEVWKLIWKAHLPPKIKNFLWKAVKGCLSTKAALFRRHLGSSPLCPICNVEQETTEHLLLTCPWVEGVWFGGALNYKIDKHGLTNLDT